MTLIQIIILAIIQGACELLPVSSSAHVIVAEKLMGIDPTRPETTMLLVALHTGTMFAVIAYFWNSWRTTYFGSRAIFLDKAKQIIVATLATAALGGALILFIEKVLLRGSAHSEVESIFGNLTMISFALAAVGVLIILAGRKDAKQLSSTASVQTRQSLWIGAIQGLCLPFRGFSRSGATISTGLLKGVGRRQAEEFSFALAVVLTPPVLFREIRRLAKARVEEASGTIDWHQVFMPSVVGMVCAFVAGILVLKWLSRWLEQGHWRWFGYYCLFAAASIFVLSRFVIS